jgi:hypothetical protein
MTEETVEVAEAVVLGGMMFCLWLLDGIEEEVVT